MKKKTQKLEFIKSFGAIALLTVMVAFASQTPPATDKTLHQSASANQTTQDLQQYSLLFSNNLAPTASVAFGDFREWFKNPLGNKLERTTNDNTSLYDTSKINLKGIISNSAYLHLEKDTLYYNNNAENPSQFKLIVEAFDPNAGIAEISGSRAFGDNPVSHIYPYTLDYSIEKDSICPESKITLYATSGSGVTNTKEIDCILDGSGPINGSISYPDGYQNNPIINIDVNPGEDNISGMSQNAEDYLLEYKTAPLENGSCGEFGEWKNTGINEITETGNYSFQGQNANCYQFRYSVKDMVSNKSVYTKGSIIKVDTTTTVLDNISINQGAETTNEPTVTLTLSAKDAFMGRTMMQLSCNHQIWTELEPFATEKQFDLTSFPGAGCNEDEGKKTVYARFSNKNGKWEDVVSDNIFYSKNNTWIEVEQPEPKNSQIWEEGGIADQFMPEMELPELRDAYAKHFKLPNGSLVAAISNVPIHYQEDGQWKEVISDYEPNTSGQHTEYEYATLHNTIQYFTPAKSGNQGKMTDFGNGGIYKSWIRPTMEWVDTDGNKILTTDAAEVEGVVDANRIIYSEVFANTDVIFTQGIFGITSDIILNNKDALNDMPSDADTLAYCENVVLPDNWTYETKPDPAYPDKIMEVIFKDGQEQEALIYPQPGIYEKENMDQMIFGHYGVRKNNQYLTICKQVPVEWLTAPERKFPVVVDPTEYLGAAYQTGSTYWSGTIGLTSNTKWNPDVDVGCWVTGSDTCPDNVEWRRGFAFFPIDSIMDGSNVTTAYVRMHSYTLTSSQTIYAYPLSSTTPSSTGASIETDCMDDGMFDYFTISAANYYHYFCLAGTCPMYSGDNSNGSAYSTTGETTLENELATGTYWGACFRRNLESSGTGNNLVRFDQWNDTNTSYRPMMYIEYDTPTITISNVTTPYLTGSYYYFKNGTSISFSGPNVGSPSTCDGHVDADTTYGGSIGSGSLGYDCTGTVSGPTCTDGTIYYGCIYACDDNGACANYSCDSTTRIRCDTSNPSGTFSISPTYYGPNTYSTTTTIAGTAGDSYSGVDKVELTIYSSLGYWWYGSGWSTGSSILTATGTTSWYYSGISSGDYTNGYTYTVSPTVVDKVGNRATLSSDSFIWDSANPTTSFSLPNNYYGPYTWPDVISGTASDSGSGVYWTLVSIYDNTISRWYNGTAPFNSTTQEWFIATGTTSWSFNFPDTAYLTDGHSYTVYVYTLDNVFNDSTTVNDSFTYDSSPPSSNSITINSGDAYTTNPSVNLALSSSDSSGVYSMRFSCDNVTYSPSVLYSATGSFNLETGGGCSAGNGTKTVYAIYEDTVGNLSTAVSDTIVFDNTAPAVTIDQASGQSDPTNTSPINFTVVFSESVTGFATGDVTLSGTAGATTATVTGSGTTYNVAVSGMTGSGTVIATIGASKATDAAGNGNTASTSTDNTVTYDITAPTGGSFTINSGATYTTSQTGNTLNVTCPTDSWATVQMAYGNSASPTNWTTCTATVSSYDLGSGQGTKTVYMRFRDGGGNTTSDITDTITLDSIAPTVTIDQASGQSDPTNTSPINFTVVFSESVTGFATGDVTLSGTAGATTATVTGSDTTYNVAVSGMTNDGTVIASIGAGVVTDAAGNPNSASTSTDNTVTYDMTGPTINSITSVAGDTTAPYYDNTNDGSTEIIFTSSDTTTAVNACKWDTSDTTYASMANSCSSTTSCTANLTGEGAKTVYIRCIDDVGNAMGSSQAVGYTINATPPTASCSVSEGTNPDYQYQTGTTLYYNSSYTGDFSIEVTASDPISGIEKVNFPTLATGFSPTSTDDYSSPYSQTYSWTTSATTSPDAKNATAYSNSGLTNTCGFTVTRDVTAPTGTITYNTQYINDLGIDPSMTIGSVTETGSGENVSSRTLQVSVGTLSDETCSAYGSYTTVSGYTGTYPTVVDSVTTLEQGKCYKYRWQVADNVGNIGTFTSANEFKVDTTIPSTSITNVSESSANIYYSAGTKNVFYKTPASSQNFTVEASANDPESGIQYVTFPGISASITPSTSQNDTSSPYSNSYTVTTSANTSYSTNTVTGRNNTGLEETDDFDITVDNSAPTGASVSCPGAYDTDGNFNVTGNQGTDSDSGVDTSAGKFQRRTGTLSNDSCSGFGSYSNVGTDTNLEQLGLTTGCYEYQYYTADLVGNSTVSSSCTVKVDTTSPSISITSVTESSNYIYDNGSTLFYKNNVPTPGSFILNVSATDTDTGIASVSGSSEFDDTPSDTESPYLLTYTIEQSSTCTSPITVTATSNAGGTNTVNRACALDTTAPVIASLSDNGATSVKAGATVSITFNLTETESGQDINPTVTITQSNDTVIGTAAYVSRSGTGNPYSYTYTYTVPAGNYNDVKIKVDANDNVSNAATQAVLSPAFNIDNTAPTVTINQAGDQADPANTSPINFTVVFSESTTNFTTEDVTLGGTAGATTATVTGSGTTYNVAVSGMTGDGTVIASIGAGVATDAASNDNTASTSTDNTVTYDTTPPGSFSISGPRDPINNTTPDITWTESSGAATYDVKVDDTSGTCPSPVASTTDVVGTSWTVSPALSNGVTYYVCVTAIDTATNTTLASNNGTYSFTVDTASPTVTINQTGGQSDPTNTSPINFTVVFNESVTEFVTGDVTLSGTAGATTATVTGSGTTYNVAVSGMTGDGTVIPTIGAGVATDAAGNGNFASTSTDNTVTYDTTPPTGGSFTINNDDTYTGSQTANTLNITCPTDNWETIQMAYGNSASPTNWTTCVSSVSSYDLGAGDGTKTVYMRFRDGGQNTTADTTDEIDLDTTAPTITTVTEDDADNYVTFGTLVNLTSDGDDTTSGITTCNAYWDNDNVSYDGDETLLDDLGIGCDGEVETPDSTDGTWYFCVRPVDNVGLSNYECTNAITYDETGPTGTITNASGNPTNDDTPTLNLTISDSGVGVTDAQMRFSCDNSTWSAWEAYSATKSNFDINSGSNGCETTDGTRTVYVQFRDSLLNEGSSANTDSFILDTTAPTAPTLTCTNYNHDTWQATNPSTTCTITDTATPSARTTTAYSTNGGSTWTDNSNLLSFTFTPTANATTNVVMRISDTGGGPTNSNTYTIKVDTLGPTGTITNASGNPTNDDTPTLNLTIDDTGVGITGAEMRFSCNNTDWTSWETYTTPKNNFDIKPDVSAYGCATTDGSRTVYVQYQDSLGNTGSSYNTGAFTLDTTALVISSTAPATGSYINAPVVSYTYSEAASSGSIVFTRTGGTVDSNSPHTCTLQGTALTTGEHTNLTLAQGANACTQTWNSMVDGTVYTVTFSASDLANNAATPVSNTSVTYDTSGPTGTITNASGNPTNDDTPTLNLTITDTGVGITGAEMRFSCNNSTWTEWESYATPKTDFDIKPDIAAYGCTTTDGTKTVYVQYRDSLSNIGSSANTGTFTLDTAPPPAPTLTCTNYTNNVWQATNPSTTCTITDTATPSARTATAYSTNGGGSWTDNSNLLSFTFTPTANATTNVIMQISDTGGGPTNSNTYIIKTDSTPPSGGDITYNNDYETDTTIRVNVNRGTDPLSGLSTNDSDYLLEYRSASLSGGNCGTFGNWTNADVTENDTATYYDYSATNGYCYQFRYTVKDAVGNTVLYTGTDTTKVSILSPEISDCSVTEGTNQQYQYQTGTTLYYNSGFTGDFNVNVTASDPEAGINYVNFPYLAEGFTPSTLAGTDDDTIPYTQNYTWSTASTTSPGAKNATVYSNSGKTSLCGFTVTRDVTAPANGSISYTTQYLTNTSNKAALTVSDGTDVGGSGINATTRILQRDTGTLSNGSCINYTGYVTTTSDQAINYPNIQDTGTMEDGKCYKYRWLVSDNVGNQAIYSSDNEVKYDSTAPTAPTPSVTESSANIYYAGGLQTLYYKTPASNQSFLLSASPVDLQSGIESVIFPGLSATITPSTDVVDTSSPYSVNYTVTTSANTSPGLKQLISKNNAQLTNSANFTVTADLAPPTGASVTCPGSYDTDGNFNVTGTSGSDSLTGVDTSASYFQRKDGTLSDNSCDYGANSFNNVGTPNAVNLEQTSLSTGCYEYRYYTVDMVGNSTTSSTCTVKVDTSVPTVSVDSVSETSNYIYYDGSTLYYTNVPATPGSLTFNISAADSDSGINNVSGSTEFGDTPSDTYPPNNNPYYTLPYTIEQSATCTTPITATAVANSGSENSTNTICTLDTAGPTEGSVTYTDGYNPGAEIFVTVDPGTDADSGLSNTNSHYYLEYNRAPLSADICGSYTGWTDANVTETASSASYSFTGVTGYCYQFRYSVRDNVYNPATFTGTDTAKIDTVPPTITSITSVAGDTTAPYYDITDDSSTSIIFLSTDSTSAVDSCKWDTDDVAYASMTHTCTSPTNCVTDLSGDGVKTVYIRCMDLAGNAMTSSEEVTYTIYSNPPTITDANISIAGGTGTGGAYKVGDTITVTWDNSTATGDGNTDLTVDPTANLSGWGGSATTTMTDTDTCGGTPSNDIWEACYTLVTGTIDNTNVNASVTATNLAGSTTRNDTTNATVDNQPPIITSSGTLTITTDNGIEGIAALNNGTGNQDKVTQSSATVAIPDNDTTTINLTSLTGQATVNAGTESGVVIPGTLDNSAQTFTITVTDDAGNTDTANSAEISVDNIPPTVTASAISVLGATGENGKFITGDTATGRWDNSATGDDNSDTISSVTFNLTDWISTAESISGTNNSGIWTTSEQSPLDSQSTTDNNVIVTATDNAGNITTTEGTNNYTIETLATDPDTSSFTATPTTVMANGISTTLLTATLRDASSDPVAGATVNVSATGATVRPINCTTTDVGVITKGRSNSNGQACFLATSSTMADNLEFTATDTSNSIEITQKAYVSYTNCLIDRSSSTFTASKAQVQTDGLDSADLDLHLTDYCGFDVDKTDVVTLDDNSATSVTYTPPGSTAPQTYSTSGGGLLTTAISSLTSGLFTFAAGLNEKQYDTTVYTENPGLPNEYNGSGSLIIGSANQDDTQVSFNMPFDFSLYSQTVTAGNPVYLCTNGFLSLSSTTCPASGALTDAIAGYHMDLTTNDGGIYQRTTSNSITFVFDAQTKSAEDVNFEIKLYDNNRIEIHYEDAATATLPFIGLYNHSSVADASSLLAPRTNKATMFEYDTPVTPFDLDNHPQVEFLAGDVNITNSTVEADPSAVTADGNSYSIVTVTVRDDNMNPIPGRNIQLDQDGSAQITQVDCGDLTTPAPDEPTDTNGKTCYQATDEIAQLVTFTATDITDLPLILGSDTVDFGCVTGPGQQCLQVTLEEGEGSITMTPPSDFSFLPASSGVFAQEQFTCDDAILCPDNLTNYNLNVDDLLTVTDTRNLGGFTVQLQASTPFERADNVFLPFQNFYVATTPATTGGTKIGGIEYDLNYSGITCTGAPLNTTSSLLSADSFLYNFGTGNTIPSTIHDLMQCEVNQGQGRNTTLKQNINYHLLIPPLQPPGLYQITLTYDLVI